MQYDRSSMKNKSVPHPLHTKAFLYYSILQGKPRISGELRLRITSSNDIALFKSGSDLFLLFQLWSHPLIDFQNIFPLCMKN